MSIDSKIAYSRFIASVLNFNSYEKREELGLDAVPDKNLLLTLSMCNSQDIHSERYIKKILKGNKSLPLDMKGLVEGSTESSKSKDNYLEEEISQLEAELSQISEKNYFTVSKLKEKSNENPILLDFLASEVIQFSKQVLSLSIKRVFKREDGFVLTGDPSFAILLEEKEVDTLLERRRKAVGETLYSKKEVEGEMVTCHHCLFIFSDKETVKCQGKVTGKAYSQGTNTILKS